MANLPYKVELLKFKHLDEYMSGDHGHILIGEIDKPGEEAEYFAVCKGPRETLVAFAQSILDINKKLTQS